MAIEFRFHPEKTVQAAAILLKLHGKPMSYLGLLKMLYLADRIALKRMEQPITGDKYFSMKYGPVLSGVYDLIKGNSVGLALPLWSKFISPRNPNSQETYYYVSLLKDPGDGELCEEEEEILQQVYKAFGHLDPFTVAEWTHDLREWQDPHGSSIPIVVEDVLRYMGKTEQEIEEIRKESEREAYLDRVLHG